jgi:AcrR family transcriptional regulator
MDRIANRARVGKQTLYRRWPSKAQLVAEAVMDAYHKGGSFELPDTGDIAADLRDWLLGYADAVAPPENAALVRALAAAAGDDPRDLEALYRQLTGPQHDAVMATASEGNRRRASSRRHRCRGGGRRAHRHYPVPGARTPGDHP